MDKFGVWVAASRSDSIKSMGRGLIPTRWVNVNKSSEELPEVRSRILVQETKHVSKHMTAEMVFSATPPLECLRMLISLYMSIGPVLRSKPEDDM
eukprot:7235856-Karenia_brevis.AAC.1